MLGLPAGISPCLVDLDGVLTRTAKVRPAAWKDMFDAFLRSRAERSSEELLPFDAVPEYFEYDELREGP